MRRFARVITALLISMAMVVLLVLTTQAQSFMPQSPQVSEAIVPDATVVITRSGGMLTSMDGQVKIMFPSGVVKEPISATLSFSVAPIAPVRFTLVGPVFEVHLSGQFSAPVTITVDYVPLTGINENELKFVYYDVGNLKWLPLPTSMDVINHVAVATVNPQGHFALVWFQQTRALPSSAVIVDDLDATRFAKFGTPSYWRSVYTTTPGYWLGHTYWTSSSKSIRNNYATWTPILAPGQYIAYTFVPTYFSNTDNARYQIVHQGITTEYPISQSAYFSEWVSLGTYYFGSGADNYVLLGDVTGEAATKLIAFDAIGFVPANTKIYLPAVIKNYPPPPLPSKVKAGMHLGNRNRADWNDPIDYLARLQGGTSESSWPAATVVPSHQVYDIERNGPGCTISKVSVKNSYVSNYLRQAYSLAGTKIIIRIWPSRGNFEDALDPIQPHNLITQTGQTPQGLDYCDGRATEFRAIDDLAEEMYRIHILNGEQGFHEYAFEPANEPNLEWYANWYNSNATPKFYEAQAWQSMDAYFSALYDYMRQAHPDAPNLRILTPPMGQGAYAESLGFDDLTNPQSSCGPMRIVDDKSGYDFMKNTYTTKNDGYSWHNYYRQSREFWASGDPCKYSDHIFQYLQPWLQDQIKNSGKISFITEADLYSPCQRGDNPVKDKDTYIDATQESVWRFVQQEQGANYVIVWLLSEDPYTVVPGPCPGNGAVDYLEIKWHEAYRDNGLEREWFPRWWVRPE